MSVMETLERSCLRGYDHKITVRANTCAAYTTPDGLMLVVKASAEAGTASRSDMDFLNFCIILINIVLFAIPVLESFMEHVSFRQS
jgi:hypothetical protein